MKRTMKVWFIAATVLITVGLIMFACVMLLNDQDFETLAATKYEANVYDINEEFSKLSINTDTADIKFVLADDGKCRIECFERKTEKHSVSVSDDTLFIKMIDEMSWYDYIGINFNSPKITVYLPKSEYTDLVVDEDTGDIELSQAFKFNNIDICLSTGDIKLSNVICDGDIKANVTTGKVYLSDIKCNNLFSNGSTGDISLNNVIATEEFSIKRSTGDIEINLCDANEIFIETDTGDVEGTLLTEKVFITKTDTGDIEVPKSVNGGRCEIITDTGDISIRIK